MKSKNANQGVEKFQHHSPKSRLNFIFIIQKNAIRLKKIKKHFTFEMHC
jgi:hypothetical protein